MKVYFVWVYFAVNIAIFGTTLTGLHGGNATFLSRWDVPSAHMEHEVDVKTKNNSSPLFSHYEIVPVPGQRKLQAN